MRFEVPQFIEIEDKIFGPFTWRQFVYIAGGTGFGVVLFLMNLPFLLFLFIGFPVIALAGALAFYPVNNRPFSIFLEAVIRYASGTKLYLWSKRSKTIYGSNDEADTLPPTIATQPPAAGGGAKNIASLARKLELNDLAPDNEPR